MAILTTSRIASAAFRTRREDIKGSGFRVRRLGFRIRASNS
jgi:hypothetical protein